MWVLAGLNILNRERIYSSEHTVYVIRSVKTNWHTNVKDCMSVATRAGGAYVGNTVVVTLYNFVKTKRRTRGEFFSQSWVRKCQNLLVEFIW